MTTATHKKHLTTLLTYPTLAPYEDSLSKSSWDRSASSCSLYSVTSWHVYLIEIDQLLSLLHETHLSNSSKSRDSKKNPVTLPLSSSPYSEKQDVEDPSSCQPLEISPEEIEAERKKLVLARLFVGERALSLLPGSYKLWKLHLEFLVSQLSPVDGTSISVGRRRYLRTRGVFERGLVRMHKFPRVWTMYLRLIQTCDPLRDVTEWRRFVDRALLALPATQHVHIWKLVGEFYGSVGSEWDVPSETWVRLLRRRKAVDPSYREEFCELCLSLGHFGECAETLVDILNDEGYLSPSGKTRHDLWLLFSKICTSHSLEDDGERGGCLLDYDKMVRAALISEKSLFGEMEGTLWKNLALYHIRRGNFQKARGVFEEGLESIGRVRDFSTIFDAYAEFEEKSVEFLMSEDVNENMEEENVEEDDLGKMDDDLKLLLGKHRVGIDAEMDLALSRAEHLMERRPLLLNRVLLRQNPHNVAEWLRRTDLYMADKRTRDAVDCMKTAVSKVLSKQAVNGSPADLFIKWATILEGDHDLPQARLVYDQVCYQNTYKFHNLDDLARCFSQSIEMELRNESFTQALSLSRRAVSANKTKRSLRLWNLLLDLEESLGTLTTTKASYEKCIRNKIATPQILTNYADYLKSNKFFEESFSAYEKAVDLFDLQTNPTAATALWKSYLNDFTDRYKGTKLERTRELFERCLSSCPPEHASPFFILYAKFEEEHGTISARVLRVYERMCTVVPLVDKLIPYQIYISKITSFLGPTKTRPVYETAMKACADKDSATLALAYSCLECDLGEVERARAIYIYGSQLVDPRRDFLNYWQTFQEFEVRFGDEDSFRDFLRVKRAVSAAFSTVNYNAAEMTTGLTSEAVLGRKVDRGEEEAMREIREMEGFVGAKPTLGGFVKKREREDGGALDLGVLEERARKLRSKVEERKVGDEEEIDLNEEDEDATAPIVPPPMGALERLKTAAAAATTTAKNDSVEIMDT